MIVQTVPKNDSSIYKGSVSCKCVLWSPGGMLVMYIGWPTSFGRFAIIWHCICSVQLPRLISPSYPWFVQEMFKLYRKCCGNNDKCQPACFPSSELTRNINTLQLPVTVAQGLCIVHCASFVTSVAILCLPPRAIPAF